VINLLQRVTEASVTVDEQRVATIGLGLLVLVGFEATDAVGDADTSQALIQRMAQRMLGYRVFPDDQQRMNQNGVQAEGEVLLVPQFTLAADTRSGLRPGFQSAAPPDKAADLFDRYVETVREHHANVQQGRFGADMQVSLVNNGPVTFWLQL